MVKKIISPELKDKIIDMYRIGTPYSEIGTETELSERTIYRIVGESIDEGKVKERSDEPETTTKKQEQEKERPLDVNLKRRTEQKIVEYSSDFHTN